MSDTSAFEFGFTYNRKVRRLSDAAFRLWITAIDHANQDGTDGFITHEDLDCFQKCPRGKERETLISELVSLGLWHASAHGWVIHDFLTWQRSAAERARRKTLDRERAQRARDAGRSPNVRRMTPDPDSGRTLDDPRESDERPSQTGSDGGAACFPPHPLSDLPESESKEERESGSADLPENKGSGRARAGRKTRLPDDWQPTAEHRERASALGLALDSEVERFRLHAAGTGRLMANWNATFTTWLINAPRFAPRAAVGGRGAGPKQPNAGLWQPKMERSE